MVEAAFGSARRHNEVFREESEEAWKQDHREAMDCIGVESAIIIGLKLLDANEMVDSVIREYSFKNPSVGDKYIIDSEAAFRIWLEGADYVERLVRVMEARGFKVEKADEFRKRARAVADALTPDAEFFNHDRLVELRDEAVDASRRGDVSALGA